jgi:hypothetical protein
MHRIFLVIAAALATSGNLIAQPASSTHPSREEAIAFLKDRHIFLSNMQLIDARWDDSSRTWIVRLRDPLGLTITWGADVRGDKIYFYGRK